MVYTTTYDFKIESIIYIFFQKCYMKNQVIHYPYKYLTFYCSLDYRSL